MYPVQGTYLNNFDANTYIQAPAAAFTLGTPATLVAIGATTPKPYYEGYESTKYGERICGLYYFESIAAAGFAKLGADPHSIGFQLAPP